MTAPRTLVTGNLSVQSMRAAQHGGTRFLRVSSVAIILLVLSAIFVAFLLSSPLALAGTAATNCAAQGNMPQEECEALVDLYNATDGPNWTDAATNNWNVTDTPCGWTGVACTAGHATEIVRGAKGLTGVLPGTLGNLANLQHLSLDSNHLTGAIPSELGNLANLQSLFMGNNQLTGTIPSELGNLANLQYLFMGNNQLTGTIPSELGNLANLQYLYLQSNQLMGLIPVSFAQLTGLSGLNISFNGLSTTDPDLASFLDSKNPDWALTQTVPPVVDNATAVSANAIRVGWQII